MQVIKDLRDAVHVDSLLRHDPPKKKQYHIPSALVSLPDDDVQRRSFLSTAHVEATDIDLPRLSVKLGCRRSTTSFKKS